MIKLYHARYTRSLRVRWLLEELGLEYELKRVAFSKGEHKTPEFETVHPLGRLPAMTDGDVHMFESGAMLQYLLEKYGEGRLHPLPGTPASAEYLQWFHFGESTHQPFLSLIAQHSAILPEAERVPAVAAKAREGAIQCTKLLDAHFSENDFVGGNTFTAADIMVTYPLVLSHLFGILPADEFPDVGKYYERISGRPAFQTATAD